MLEREVVSREDGGIKPSFVLPSRVMIEKQQLYPNQSMVAQVKTLQQRGYLQLLISDN